MKIEEATDKDDEPICRLFKKLDVLHATVEGDRFKYYEGKSRSPNELRQYLEGGDRVLLLAKKENEIKQEWTVTYSSH